MKSRKSSSSRRVTYVLGAGFSIGSGHFARYAGARIDMPLQRSFFKVLNDFKNKQTKSLDPIAEKIRLYFSPSTYRTTKKTGRDRHKDLDKLSVEEVVTFFDEIGQSDRSKSEIATATQVNQDLVKFAAELISFLSLKGSPGKNQLIKKFVSRIKQTDAIITFNWDTLLDRVLSNNQQHTRWQRGYGYGPTIRKLFPYKKWRGKTPEHYPRLLKLHGSVNWVSNSNSEGKQPAGKISEEWGAKANYERVVMMAPKMIKVQELKEDLYKKLWKEAETQLIRSKRLVFIGYSFPPADYAVANLLRRVFSKIKKKKRKIPQIVIVDPEASERARNFEESFGIHIEIENMFLSLSSFVTSSRLG